jgi:hypothetical protein
MAALIGALLAVIATWMVLATVLSGCGLLVHRLSRLGPPAPRQFMLLPWLGFCLAILVLQIWHLAFPINSAALGMVSLLGLVGWIWDMGSGQGGLRSLATSMWRYRGAVCVGLVCMLWLADRAIGPCNYGDSGLYHISAVQWANEHKVVPGLANLHVRFGFNNSSFLYDAMLSWGPWQGRSGHIANGLLCAMMVPIFVWAGHTVLVGSGRRWRTALFVLPIVVLCVKFAISPEICSFTTDLPAALLALLASWRLLALLLLDNREKGSVAEEASLVIWFLATAVTVKLSVLFYALPVVATALLVGCVQLRRESSPPEPARLVVFIALIGAALLVGGWIARGYVLSGCPLYPSSVGCAHADWVVSNGVLAEVRHDIKQFARTTHLDRGIDISGFAWVKPWFVQLIILRSFAETLLPAILAVGGVVIWAQRYIRSRSRLAYASAAGHAWLMALPLGIALIVWFFTVPSPRMGTHLWWSAAGLAMAIAPSDAPGGWLSRHPRIIVFAAMALSVLPILHLMVLIQVRYRHDPAMIYYRASPLVALFYGTGSDHGFHPTPVVQVEVRRTDSGLDVNVPPADQDNCWGAPIPCTPYFNPKLQLRVPDQIGGGFRIGP